MADTKTMFMHMIDGEPAAYSELWQLIYRVPKNSTNHPVTLVDSMDVIREQRRLSDRARRREHLPPVRYGFRRVAVPVARPHRKEP